MLRKASASGLLAAVLALAACGADGPPVPPPAEPEVRPDDQDADAGTSAPEVTIGVTARAGVAGRIR